MGSNSSGSTSRGSSPIPYRARSLKTDKSVYAASNKVRIFFTLFRTVANLLRRTQWNCRKSQNIYYSRITVLLHRCLGWNLEIGWTCVFHVNVRRKKLDPTKRKCLTLHFSSNIWRQRLVVFFSKCSALLICFWSMQGPLAHQRTSEQGSNEVVRFAIASSSNG